MYHYFAAAEIYNAIRIFIAAYVWMTGFGNFSYYYIRKDFSVARFAQVIHFFPWQNSPHCTLLPQHLKSCSLTDDVEAELLCSILLYCSQQRLYVVLHLPNAHSLHPNGVRSSWYLQQVQWSWISDGSQDIFMLPPCLSHVGNPWSFWNILESINILARWFNNL